MSAWYPCENPERPNDGEMVWHYGECHGCHTAAIATKRRHPDDSHVEWVVQMTKPPERQSFVGFMRETLRRVAFGEHEEEK